MFLSTIIPTIGRPTLSRAVHSVLNQKFDHDDFEIIVVNDSGRPLPAEPWQAPERVQIINTNKRERCVARNTGAAIATGRYLHFLDDDDWLLPDALNSFWMLSQEAEGAAWLYGSSQLVDRQGKNIIQLHHNLNGNCFIHAIAGEWIPLQASCIRADTFFAVGGFHPLVLATQDVDLCRRILLHGDLAGTSNLVACVGMGLENSVTDYTKAPLYSRWGREEILNQPGTFTRMRQSASSGYWHGRIVRAYLTSAVWNLQYRQVIKSASRLTWGLINLILSAQYALSIKFWQAILKNYESETFLRGFQEANRPVERRETPELLTDF